MLGDTHTTMCTTASLRLIFARFLAALLTTPVGFSCGAVAETVHFRSATTQPSALQQRLARERGQAIAPQLGAEIAGELYHPEGSGPFPAVVLLHGCTGRWPRPYEEAVAQRFMELGYAVLAIDSFSPRGIKELCTPGDGIPNERVMDAYGGLEYLAVQPFIDPEHIAVVGYSQGGSIALAAVTLDGMEGMFDRHFRASVAYYPGLCARAGTGVSVPTLILIGALDDWAPARDCQNTMAQRGGEGAPIKLVIFPGAYHAFDATTLRDKPLTYMGHHLEYNEAADHAAWQETVAALRQAFGR